MESDATGLPEREVAPWRVALEPFSKGSAKIDLSPLPAMERITNVEGAISYEEAIRQLLAKRNVQEMTDEELTLRIALCDEERAAEVCHDG